MSDPQRIQAIRATFAELVGPDQLEPPLARTALLIAAEERPEIDVEGYLRQLAEHAGELGRRIGSELDPYLIIGILNRYLFEELGFTGNQSKYYDPRNSMLDQVIDRRTGIPITLGLIYIELARALSLPVHGLNVPGHFLVAYQSADERLCIDCFGGGEVILPGKLGAFLRRRFTGDDVPGVESAELISNRAILTRLLNNLKRIYIRRIDLRRALAVSDRLLLLNPGAAFEYRDRGVINFHLSQFSGAIPDFERYLQLNPEAPDAEKVRLMMSESKKQLGQDA